MTNNAFDREWRRRFEGFGEAGLNDASIAGWSDTGLEMRLRCFRRRWIQRAREGLWLDAGCGAGTYCRLLADAGLTVVGADFSYPTIRQAARKYGTAAAWLVSDVARLPLRHASFDGALCFGVLQAVSDPRSAVSGLAGCLRAGGEVWLDALNARCLPNLLRIAASRMTGKPTRMRYDSPRRLVRLLRELGFEEIERFWVPILPARFARFQWIMETTWVVWLLHAVPALGGLLSHSVMITARRRRPAAQ